MPPNITDSEYNSPNLIEPCEADQYSSSQGLLELKQVCFLYANMLGVFERLVVHQTIIQQI